MRWKELSEERCSVARTVAVIGDRWTLLILRDCFLRVRRFDAFEERLGITRHVLADRLKKLVAHGVLKKVPYQHAPVRYEYRLTQTGLDLYPVLTCLRHWGDRYAAGRRGRPLLFRHRDCGHMFDPVLTCSGCGEPIDPHAVDVLPGPGANEPQRRATRTSGPRTPRKQTQRSQPHDPVPRDIRDASGQSKSRRAGPG
jgi:DNA-binding HxlR family transcriptional regulator